ncbi:MAG TPA: hypothetical protein VFK04_08550 [Gemmatimonadaceae bacterium]|nr:hypothetical protein [Gemmatimonadaceae bacterium]
MIFRARRCDELGLLKRWSDTSLFHDVTARAFAMAHGRGSRGMHGQLHQPIRGRRGIQGTGIDGVTVARIALVSLAWPHHHRRHLEPDRAQPLDHLLRLFHSHRVQHDHVGERHQR